MNAVVEFDALPLSPEQRAAQRNGAPPATLCLAISGPLDAHRLHRAWQAVTAAHWLLRCTRTDLGQRPDDDGCDKHWSVLDLTDQADATGADVVTPTVPEADGPWVAAALLWRDGGRIELCLRASPCIADRGSLAVLAHDLHAAYRDDGHWALPADGPHYGHYIQWRQAMQFDEDAAGGRAYWTAIVGDTPPAPPQFAFRRPGRSAGAGASVSLPLAPTLAAALAAQAESLGHTAETLLQAAWWAMLGRLSGQAAFSGGWLHDCRRDYEDFAPVVGVFDKVLPVIISPAADMPFGRWVDTLGGVLDDHRAWQEHWPVDAPPTDAHLSVGFRITDDPLVDDDWSLIEAPVRHFELCLDAHLGVGDRPTAVSLHYAPARYRETTVQALLDQYVSLLGALPTLAGRPLGLLPLGDAAQAVLHGPDSTPDVQSLPLIVARWGQETPNAPALESSGGVLTYAQLNAQVNRLACWLQEQGAGPDVPVALCLPRSPNLVIAVLAVMRAGAAYLPLDPTWPAVRCRRIVEAAGPRLVLSATAMEGLGACLQVTWPELVNELIDYPDTPPPVAIAPEHAAYVLFTSGSTGEPKGVVVEHRQLMNYVHAASEAMDLRRCRCFALTSTVAADLGNTTLFGAFYHGARLMVADDAAVNSPADFARFLRRHAVDCVKIVPSHLAALLDDDDPALPDTLILGGEPTSMALAARILRLAPRCQVFNHYGPTETTVGVMTHRLNAAELDEAICNDIVPLTRVMANCSVQVLDAALRPVPPGAVGSLYLGGAQLCRGYLGGGQGEVFIDDPQHPGQRVYRSGDRALLRHEGGIVVLGRDDAQVKIRGFRIEPGEVEAVIQALPGVAQAAVVARATGSDTVLVACVVPTDKTEPTVAMSRRLDVALADLLPEPMRPTRWRFLDALPRLANGKIDRAGLPTDEHRPVAEKTQPRDALETLLASHMASLLEAEVLGVDEDFFEAGGHSLLVIKLVAAIRKAFQLEVPPAIVFDNPTVAALAQALREREPTPGTVEKAAGLRLKLAAMTPEQREALRRQASGAKGNSGP